MKKQELANWLAEHMAEWPTTALGTIELPTNEWAWGYTNIDKTFTISELDGVGVINKTYWEAARIKPVKFVQHPPAEAMIDIETFDTESHAIVFQAAVVMFDENHDIIYQEQWNLDFTEQYDLGRSVSASTIKFHLDQPENAAAALDDKQAVDIQKFADGLRMVFKEYNPHTVWAKGNMDDNVLQSLFKDADRTAPWKFYQMRELRTLMAECGVQKGEVAHNALQDCIDQVRNLKLCRDVTLAGLKALQPVGTVAE